MKVGFTGTREGMTAEQRMAVYAVLSRWRVSEAHHGDCVGADAQFHDLVLGGFGLPDVRVILHPPDVPTMRAFCLCVDEVREPKPYLERNHDIVDECDVLIAAPWGFVENQRSGTWATVRYARRTHKPVYLVLSDGTVKSENVGAAPCRNEVEAT